MAYCVNCGHKLLDGDKFCSNCGHTVPSSNSMRINPSATSRNNLDRESFEGSVHKCPNCGTTVSSFETICSACGYEFRDGKSAESVKEFAYRLAESPNANYTISLIRNFPIPNTKEDILEFCILASSNIRNEHDYTVSQAWYTKLDQVYQKAQFIISDPVILSRINEIYTTASPENRPAQNIKNQAVNPSPSNTESGALAQVRHWLTKSNRTKLWKFLIWLFDLSIAIGAEQCAISPNYNYNNETRTMFMLLAYTGTILFSIHLIKSRPRITEYFFFSVFIVGLFSDFVEETKCSNSALLILAVICLIVAITSFAKNEIFYKNA